MKRLFYIANVRLPTEKAHGMQIMKSCEALAKTGLSVELLIPRRLNPLKANPFEYYGVKHIFKITRLPVLDSVSCGRIGFWFETLVFLLIARLYLWGRKGVVYTREEVVGIFFSKFVLETHMIPDHPGFFRRFIWRRARMHFVLTSFIKRKLIALGVPSQKIALAPDAVDLAQFDLACTKDQARQKVGFPQDKKIVMYTGSFFLYDWKGVDVMLEAAKDFRNEVLFVLIGGSEREVNEAKHQWGRENIVFLGYRAPTEIPLYLKTADALIIPNKKGTQVSERYTSPLKLFEYMASGRPIISSDLPSLREVVGDSEVVFFEPNNTADLSRAIRRVLGDASLAERLSKNVRTRVGAFTWDVRMKTILQQLREL